LSPLVAVAVVKHLLEVRHLAAVAAVVYCNQQFLLLQEHTQ
jgi:hypothetical protein